MKDKEKKDKKPRTVEMPPMTEPPTIADPVVDPPVPNRAWTEMKLGRDIDMLTEEEKADLYIGHDRLI